MSDTRATADARARRTEGPWRRTGALLLAALMVTGLSSAARAATLDPEQPGTCTVTWDGGGTSQELGEAANWTPERVPGAADVACLSSAHGAAEVTMSTGSLHVGALRGDSRLVHVTAGGWVQAPAGSCGPARSCGEPARAEFGFHVRGTGEAPRGQVQLNIRTHGLRLHADRVEWVAASGSRAVLAGTGTLNGRSGARYRITVADGGPTSDAVRVEVWDSAGHLVWDNVPGGGLTAAPQRLSGGSVTVHGNDRG